MNKCDVLITYCWNRVGYNILRSLTSKGLTVWTADTSKKNICSSSKFCAGSFVYPDPFTQEDAFIQCLKKKVRELNPKVLLPTHDESQVIMRHRQEFPANLIIPYMDAETLETLSDKAWATEKAAECGVPVPQIYKKWKDVDKFPCVFKTVIGNSAKNVFFPKNTIELEKLVKKFRGEKTLIEEWIGGTDYSADCIRWDDFFKVSVYHALVTKTDGGGTTMQRVIASVPELEKFARMLLDHIEFKGVCGIDFRYEPKTGKVAFIEVNARFTGGIATPITAGFNIPWIVYSLATIGRYDEPINVNIGTRTKWILGDIITLVGYLFSLKFKWQEWKQVLTFKGFDAFDDYRKDDRCAIWGEMAYYWRKLIKNGKLNP